MKLKESKENQLKKINQRLTFLKTLKYLTSNLKTNCKDLENKKICEELEKLSNKYLDIFCEAKENITLLADEGIALGMLTSNYEYSNERLEKSLNPLLEKIDRISLKVQYEQKNQKEV